METRSTEKQIKLDPKVDNEVHINDILKLYPVRQNVFKYLDGSDIIRVSEVNKEWYKFTGETQQMKKIGLSFGFEGKKKRPTEEHMKILRSSKRKYQNIRIGLIGLELILPILKDRAGSWKSVGFKCFGFSNFKWREVLRIIEPSVEELNICETCDFVGLEGIDQVDQNWTFPCLKSIKTSDWDPSIFKYFLRCTGLVKFQWKDDEASTEMKRDMQTILRNNKGLEEFEIISWGSPVETLPDHPFEFKLKKFCIRGNYRGDTSVYSFLERQAPNLETLEICSGLNQVSLELILVKMPKLKSLAFHYEKADIDWTQTFPVNKTISSLKLCCWLHSKISFTNLFRALPNLKHIELSQINDEQLLSLAQEISALESLEVTDFKVSRLPEENLFPQLKKITVLCFIHNLKESTVDNNLGRLVKEAVRKR